MVGTEEEIGGIEGGKSVKNGDVARREYSGSTHVVTDTGDTPTYSDSQREKTARTDADRERITEAVFYIFDENGLFVSKNIFAGADDYKLNFTKNGQYSVYVLCNMSDFIDLPDAPTQNELESLAIPHKTSYLHLPFAGKTQVEVVPGDRPAIKIKLAHINSAIRIENRSADRMELTQVTVNGLPSRGNIFATDTEATGVTYSESAEAEIDTDGNAVVYSFFVPESEIANLKIEAKATVENTTEEASTIAPLSFLDRLETGKRATALVGYLESGNLKIGTPDNWGNVGRYELPGGVQLQVVGGEFFDYKTIKALRAFSGGSDFSCIVKAADGVATLNTVATVDWVTIRDNIITVA
ncbi:MAG: FimB/Mfa2 family fimbrial subunit, partial [Rikenellaceae bacterium]|nr:FimB/Mfa2 family fimbrial subunit [Rikenellaceae bacterium]